MRVKDDLTLVFPGFREDTTPLSVDNPRLATSSIEILWSDSSSMAASLSDRWKRTVPFRDSVLLVFLRILGQN